MLKKNEWNPGIKEFFFSDSYLERKELYKYIKEDANTLHGSILDIGCGTKPYEHLFMTNKYIGLEIIGGGINNADYFYDGKLFPFNNEEFDNIVSFQVIYQVFDLDTLIIEMNRVLKCNAHILITVPFIWFDGGGNLHRRFSEQYTKIKFEQHGFEIKKIKQTNANLSALCVLANKYINKSISNIKVRILRILLRLVVTSIFNLIGLFFIKFIKKDNELYITTILLARKVKNV